MVLSILKKKRVYLTTGIILFVVFLLAGCEALNQQADDVDEENPLGNWKVTEITGFITDERTGGGDPMLCEYFLEKYYPILDDDLTYIQFTDRKDDPDLGYIPPDLLDAGSALPYTGGVFVFYFTFDNGYYSNWVLDDFGVQYQYESIIPGTFTYAAGKWTEDELAGSMQTGTAGGGYNIFRLTGIFVSDTRIEGEWQWTEHTAWPAINAPECDSDASGSGTWVAVRK